MGFLAHPFGQLDKCSLHATPVSLQCGALGNRTSPSLIQTIMDDLDGEVHAELPPKPIMSIKHLGHVPK
jgi:hypothetical protein